MPAGSPRPLLRLALLRVAGWLLRVQPRRPVDPRVPRILLLRPDHLGDVLLTSPSIALLEAALPDAQFTYLVGPWGADVARHGPLGQQVQTLPFPGFARRPARNPLAPYLLLWRQATRLRRARYDLAVIFRPDHWWGALLARAAGIPLRVGFDLPETRPLLSSAVGLARGRHAAEQSLALARAAASLLGYAPPTDARERPIFETTDEERATAGRILAHEGLTDRAVVAIHPSAGVPLKSWPTERWAAVADALLDAGFGVLLSGGPHDAALLREVQRSMVAPRVPVVQGQPLGVAAALLARCVLAIGPDNGPLHLAAAMGVPTVRLYGPASPAIFGPWPPGDDQRVVLASHLPCIPCGDLWSPPCAARHLPPCMLAHSVEDVLRAAQAALGDGPRPASPARH